MSSPEKLLDSACNDLNNTGINAAFEAALLSAAQKRVPRDEMLLFVAKEIERFGRQWKNGYIDKNRHLIRKRTVRPAQSLQDSMQKPHRPALQASRPRR